MLLICKSNRASLKKVVEPKPTPEHEGVGVIVDVLVGGGVAVMVRVTVGVGVSVVVAVGVGVYIVSDWLTLQIPSKVSVVLKLPYSCPPGVLLKSAQKYCQVPAGCGKAAGTAGPAIVGAS